jgi:DNA mismatch repair protein MutL
MTVDDLRVAVRQHTTSKLGDADDLDAVSTLGFRGEALYTVGSVSKMTVTTRPRNAGDSGSRIVVDHGDGGDVEPAGRPAGTTVEVGDLFGETPARRKYLKRPATEFGHVNRAVTRYALANPGVAVSLTHDGREVFATTGTGDVRDAALAVYGREVAQSLREVDAEPDAGSVARVHGYVSDPEVTRSTREYLATFVNGRAVTDTVLREAVLDGYGGQLAPDRYPFAVLFVDCEGVDANVHPRKLEVRFADEAGVKRAVESAVRDALLDSGLVRSGAPRGASKPDDAEITPGSGIDDSETGETAGVSDGHGSGAAASGTASDSSAAGFGDGASFEATSDGSDESATDVESTDSTRQQPEPMGESRASSFDPPAENARLTGDTSSDDSDETDPVPERDSLPEMRVLGQLHGTYVVAEAEDGLVLVDQHAADERVHYERLRDKLDGASQALVAPVELELTAGEAAVFESALGGLRELGFDAELAGRTARVTAVPAVLSDALDPELARDVLAEFLADAGGDPVGDAADALLSDLACSPAIKGNTSLTEGSVVALLDALDGCENPYACPHGRPTVVEVDGDELAARFERDYPGHAGRRREDAGN